MAEIENRAPDAVTWVLTDGRAGSRASALGLAEAVGLPVVEKTVALAKPWIWLPPRLWPPGPLGVPARDASSFAPPWPALIITCGRRAIGSALEIRRRARGMSRLVHVQHPRMDPARFDLVVAPAHDRLDGPNVVVTTGSVHRVTPEKLRAAAADWHERLSHVPRPRVAVLIGGSNAAYRIDAESAARLGSDLARLARETGCGILATLSRRTDNAAGRAFRDALTPAGDAADIWSGEDENPYLGYLGLADRILVTADSVNMISEAAATGKPVQIVPLPAHGRAAKFERFHRAMIAADAARPFGGRFADWDVRVPDDTARAAARVRALL